MTLVCKHFSSSQNCEKIETYGACLVSEFKLTFSHFKQHYTYLHTFFHPHVFQKISNNNSQAILRNTLNFLIHTA